MQYVLMALLRHFGRGMDALQALGLRRQIACPTGSIRWHWWTLRVQWWWQPARPWC